MTQTLAYPNALFPANSLKLIKNENTSRTDSAKNYSSAKFLQPSAEASASESVNPSQRTDKPLPNSVQSPPQAALVEHGKFSNLISSNHAQDKAKKLQRLKHLQQTSSGKEGQYSVTDRNDASSRTAMKSPEEDSEEKKVTIETKERINLESLHML